MIIKNNYIEKVDNTDDFKPQEENLINFREFQYISQIYPDAIRTII